MLWALLDIRALAWVVKPPPIREIHAKGAIADWLHDMASYSPHDFKRFNEQWFWDEWEGLQKTHGPSLRHNYEQVFDTGLADLQRTGIIGEEHDPASNAPSVR